MFKNGDIKYHLCSNGKLTNKGSFTLNSESKVEQVDAVTLNITIDKRVYNIIQPTSSQLNYQQQQEKGFSCFIDDWFREINKFIENSDSGFVQQTPSLIPSSSVKDKGIKLLGLFKNRKTIVNNKESIKSESIMTPQPERKGIDNEFKIV